MALNLLTYDAKERTYHGPKTHSLALYIGGKDEIYSTQAKY